jgi:hypothetical protein
MKILFYAWAWASMPNVDDGISHMAPLSYEDCRAVAEVQGDMLRVEYPGRVITWGCEPQKEEVE